MLPDEFASVVQRFVEILNLWNDLFDLVRQSERYAALGTRPCARMQYFEVDYVCMMRGLVSAARENDVYTHRR